LHQLTVATTPEGLFAELLAAEPSRPFVTYYDEATGERTELSVKSLANWIAKTHFLLVDELGLGAGDTALISLPAHWISVAPLLGALTAGLRLTADGPAEVAFVGDQRPGVEAAAALAPEVFAVAPASAALGFRGAEPEGTVDFVVAVRPQADAWGSVRFGATATDPCLDGATRAEVAARAADRAGELGLRRGARVLTTRPWTSATDWLDTLLAPLAVGGSVVYIANCRDSALLDRRAEQERVTDRI
jgi:uncharacterized protein (TIGR03089 family)